MSLSDLTKALKAIKAILEVAVKEGTFDSLLFAE
tara:strand:- start:181 stop:282 length:102 start_codon:yes stop_codon:yes gene_type:complete